jgi:hypothetical protein
MARRLSLPLTEGTAASREAPSAGDVRKRLGGVGQTEAGAGMVVRFVEDPGAGTLGVVVFRSGEEVDVYLGDGWLRRTRRDAVAEFEGEAPSSLSVIADDARVFSTLLPGQPVRFQSGDGELRTGVLLEKCRFGAIVVRDDKRLVGVGFRKLWPMPAGDPA